MEEDTTESGPSESEDILPPPVEVDLELENNELSGPIGRFVDGGRALLIDEKGREAFVKLREGGQSHTHAGYILHNEILGKPDGYLYTTNTGAHFVALIPGLDDTVLKMPRGAQVIYPKDLGAILIQADIFPGAKVLEAGVGSGAMSMALVRAGAHVTGYEIREDFALRAIKNVSMLARRGDQGSFTVVLRDIYQGISEAGYDRVILDLPEPWLVVPHLGEAMTPGARICVYQTSMNQVAQFKHSLARAGFSFIKTVEILERGWYIEGRAVRPDHRMVAHTGFLTSAKYIPALFSQDRPGKALPTE
ncbi:MAG: tRNA (adenine-N1)-methyltransferase [Actinomycetota bacterium]|nr:MAG: tRNA (adenine-N1)-methyltransferase [Actinomycetota bacterium]